MLRTRKVVFWDGDNARSVMDRSSIRRGVSMAWFHIAVRSSVGKEEKRSNFVSGPAILLSSGEGFREFCFVVLEAVDIGK